ncbi:MAG: protein phosphatase [Chloroflexi bacterium]|nr:MAG: protein phosphatase [Chloroflexota bacterium]
MKLLRKIYRIVKYRMTVQGLGTTALWAFNHLYRVVTGMPYRPSSEVSPQLLLGGQYYAWGWKRMKGWGINGVVNVRDEFDDREAGIAPELYLHLPTPDDEAPTLEQLQQGVQFIEKVTGEGGMVYVHCKAGVGRAAIVTAAYIVNQGTGPRDAWEMIRKVRPFIKPTEVQITQLERFAGMVKTERLGES